MSESYVTRENLAQKTAEWMKAIERRNTHKWPFDIAQAALFVIDMQRYFLEEPATPPHYRRTSTASAGKRDHGYCCGGVAVIENVKKLVEHFRAAGRPIIFTRHAHEKDGSDLGILGKWWEEMPVDGTPEAEIDPRLNPPLIPTLEKGEKGGFETILTKNRYSAFFGTNLDEILRKLAVNEVVITGIMTNICCESTARDAFFRDYMVRFVADATGTVKEEMHVGTLLNMAYAFADVCTTEELILGVGHFRRGV